MRGYPCKPPSTPIQIYKSRVTVHYFRHGIKMAKGKVTKITKDDQTSRRKRTRGLIKKSWELGVRPSCKVFTFVLYTDVNQVKTYDSTGGEILDDVESVINRLVRHKMPSI